MQSQCGGRGGAGALGELAALQERADNIFLKRQRSQGPGEVMHGDPVASRYSPPPPRVHSPLQPQAPPELRTTCRAVVVGAGHVGQQREMRAVCAAARRLHGMLPSLGVQERWLLCDDGGPDAAPPSRANIADAARWLAQSTQPGDGILFAFAGYSGQLRTTAPDGQPATLSALCPVDQELAGLIAEDELADLLLRPLPQGSRLLILTDVPYGPAPVDLRWQLWAGPGGVGERDDPGARQAHDTDAEVIALRGVRNDDRPRQAGAVFDAFCSAVSHLGAPTLRAVVAEVGRTLRLKWSAQAAAHCGCSVPSAWDQRFSLLPPPVQVVSPEHSRQLSPPPYAPQQPEGGGVVSSSGLTVSSSCKHTGSPAPADGWGGALRHAALSGWTPDAGPPQPPAAVAAAAAAAQARDAYDGRGGAIVRREPDGSPLPPGRAAASASADGIALHVSAPSGCQLQLHCSGFSDGEGSPRGGPAEHHSPAARQRRSPRAPRPAQSPGPRAAGSPAVAAWAGSEASPAAAPAPSRTPSRRRKRGASAPTTTGAPSAGSASGAPQRGSSLSAEEVARLRLAAADRAAARHRLMRQSRDQGDGHDDHTKEVLRAARQRERDFELGAVRRYQHARQAAERREAVSREVEQEEVARRREQQHCDRLTKHAERIHHYQKLRIGPSQQPRPSPPFPVTDSAVWALPSPARSNRGEVADIVHNWNKQQAVRRAQPPAAATASPRSAGSPRALPPGDRAVLRRHAAQQQQLRSLQHREKDLIQTHLLQRVRLESQLQRQLQGDSTTEPSLGQEDSTVDTASELSRAELADRGLVVMPATARAAARRITEENRALRRAIGELGRERQLAEAPPAWLPRAALLREPVEPAPPPPPVVRRVPISPVAPVVGNPPLRPVSPLPTEHKEMQTPPALSPGPETLAAREHNMAILRQTWFHLRHFKTWKKLKQLAQPTPDESEWENKWEENEEGEWAYYVKNPATGEWEAREPPSEGDGEGGGEWVWDDEAEDWVWKGAEGGEEETENWVWNDEKGDYDYYDWVWSDEAGDYEWAVTAPPEE